MPFDEELAYAKSVTATMRAGQRFELKDLYPAQTWKAIGNKDVRKLGRVFSLEVEQGRVPRTRRVDADKRGNNKYEIFE